MSGGFFNLVTKESPNKIIKKSRISERAKCDICKLNTSCHTPNFPIFGKGNKKILIISEIPTSMEDDKGVSCQGTTGHLLKKHLSDNEINLENDCWETKAILCNGKFNDKTVNYCRYNLLQTIKRLKPNKIITLGKNALNALIGDYITVGAINKWIGNRIPDQTLNCCIYPTYDLKYLLQEDNIVIDNIFTKNIKNAIEHNINIPTYSNWKDSIIITTDEKRAIKILNDLTKEKYLAFDYEASGLRLYNKGHKLYSVSFSNGKKSWAFPIFESREFKRNLRDILCNADIKKIAYNLQYEQNSTRTILGYEVEGWHYDPMIGTHILNNIMGICGLKHQTYINYGISGYDDYSSQFFTRGHANLKNKIAEGNINKILEYNAGDSLFTYWLFVDQSVEFSRAEKKAYNLFQEGSIVLSKIHDNGVLVDRNEVDNSIKNTLKEMKVLSEKIYSSKEVNKWDKIKKFDFGGDDLSHLLFNCLKYKKGRITDSGKASADKEELARINTEFTKNIIKYNQFKQLTGTFLKNFYDETCDDNILRSFYKLHVASSYRSSCGNPNFQNIPVRDPIIKKACRTLIYPHKGMYFAETDFKGVEVSTSACIHNDPNMIKYVTDPSTDMHRDTSADLFLKEKEEITKDERFCGKNGFVFAQFYGDYWGNCATALWDLIGEDTKKHLKLKGLNTYSRFEKHVKKVEEIFWGERFPIYAQWKDDVWEQYQEEGEIKLVTGFTCRTVMGKNQVCNYYIQGPAFHINLYSIIKTQKKIKERGLKTLIVGQIHDSMVMNIVPEELEIIKEIIQEGLNEIIQEWKWIIVPLTIEFEMCPEIDQPWYYKEEIGNIYSSVVNEV